MAYFRASQVTLVVKNPLANAGDTRDVYWIPKLERSPGVGNGNPLSILAWKIPWTEEPGGLQSMKSQKSWTRLGETTMAITLRTKKEIKSILYRDHLQVEVTSRQHF